MEPETIWLCVGFAGQGLFFSRFFVQWIASERRKRSVIPTAFWYLSLGGGLTLLSYAIHRRDPVFVTGQATGIFIYLRNLWFVRREKAEGRLAGGADPERAEPATAEPAPR